ncbi:MAG: threonine ammonia-lyase [Planctomycetes bacterium]|nr:threonine ammonia-lyase [Planctomycetota bacterium]
MSVSLADITAARERIRDAVYRSPSPYSLNLSRLCGCDIYCKLEHLQMTGSFKERGARNKLLTLTDAERARGVIAASAGNHALGLAYHGQLLGIPVTVVMPQYAPLIKIANCRGFGATILIEGETYQDARTRAEQLATERGLTFIHGFDDPAIIAGQGTIGLELMEDIPDLDAVIVPVGGGGLIAGVGSAVKAINPRTRVIAVESRAATSFHASLQAGRVTRVKTSPTLADGLAIAEIGALCFAIAREIVDDLVLVDEAEIATAVLRLLELEKTVVEGAGAVPLAAALNRRADLAGKKVALLLCGGNIDVTTIARVIERGLAADGRLCRIVTQISDRPGSLVKVLSVVAGTGGSVKEVAHDRNFGPADVARVAISCVVETRDAEHIAEIERALATAGIVCRVER